MSDAVLNPEEAFDVPHGYKRLYSFGGHSVRHVSYTDLRHNLARHLDETVESRAPLLVTRQGGKPSLVILSEEAFSSWQETVYLLSNPANAARLMQSVEDAEAGQVQAHDLVDRAS